jgi:hypothetical protein
MLRLQVFFNPAAEISKKAGFRRISRSCRLTLGRAGSAQNHRQDARPA